MQAPVADSSRFPENQAITAAAIKAAMPHTGFSEIDKMAGNVITDSVTYGR